jgi:hypothetical protein
MRGCGISAFSISHRLFSDSRCCCPSGLALNIHHPNRCRSYALIQQPFHATNTGRCMGSWPKIRPLWIRAITMDVTGTLVSFRGTLLQHYVHSAEKCGVTLPQAIQFDVAFKTAYKEISLRTL